MIEEISDRARDGEPAIGLGGFDSGRHRARGSRILLCFFVLRGDRGRICCWTLSSKLELELEEGRPKDGSARRAKPRIGGTYLIFRRTASLKSGLRGVYDGILISPYWDRRLYFSIVR
jgi:hypothetical protein